MGRGNINGILTWVMILLVVFVVGSIFVALIPYLLIGGLILWVVFKIKGVLEAKNNKKDDESVTYERTIYYTKSFTNEKVEKVIDVEFEDVEK